SNSVVVFSRDAATGSLTFVEKQQDGVNGVAGLYIASAVAVSGDGKHVYACGFGNAVVVFARNAATGALTWVESEHEGVGGVTGIAFCGSLALSPDGQHVYAIGSIDKALAVFDRDPATGALTFVEADVRAPELFPVNTVAESPDGVNLYATAGDAVTVFSPDRGARDDDQHVHDHLHVGNHHRAVCLHVHDEPEQQHDLDDTTRLRSLATGGVQAGAPLTAPTPCRRKGRHATARTGPLGSDAAAARARSPAPHIRRPTPTTVCASTTMPRRRQPSSSTPRCLPPARPTASRAGGPIAAASASSERISPATASRRSTSSLVERVGPRSRCRVTA